jgi:lipopolysaccharide biosynthesis glycosyltransferase
MTTPDVSQATIDLLEQEPNVIIRPIETYDLPKGLLTDYMFERFSQVWNKLRSWQLVEYDLLCWLDADMLVLRNMDELFSLLKDDQVFAASHACICNTAKHDYPSWWNPGNCFYNSTPGQPLERRYFNSGMFLFRPDATQLDRMEKFLINKHDVRAYKFADQDFLNEYFPDFVQLPYIYNTLKTFKVSHKEIWDLKKIKNIHYILDKY